MGSLDHRRGHDLYLDPELPAGSHHLRIGVSRLLSQIVRYSDIECRTSSNLGKWSGERYEM
jgi:hypothetical protein